MSSFREGWDRVFSKQKELSLIEFNSLLEYSTSIPTGVVIGKRWKKRIYDYDESTGAVIERGWMIGEFVNISKPNHVGIRWWDVLLTEAVS